MAIEQHWELICDCCKNVVRFSLNSTTPYSNEAVRFLNNHDNGWTEMYDGRLLCRECSKSIVAQAVEPHTISIQPTQAEFRELLVVSTPPPGWENEG